MNSITRLVVTAGAIAIAAAPALSMAATYAYVNTQGEVRTVEAASGNAAIIAAPGIDPHSGVMIIDSPDDNKILSQ